MNNSSNLITQMWLDFEALSVDTIALSPEAIDKSVTLSAQILNPQRQWQTYLNGLALFGFQEWLAQRDSVIEIEPEKSSLFKPSLANVIEGVIDLTINNFRIYLITTGSLTDEEVTIPRAVIDLPEFVPHFYVLMEVQEEQEIAVIRGFLSYNRLVELRETVNLQPESDWTYQLPLTWFDSSGDRFLLNLRCLSPNAIPLPAVVCDRDPQLNLMQQQLTRLLPQLHSPQCELWQVLTWEEGIIVLTHPELLSWIYELQISESQAELSTTTSRSATQVYLADLIQLLTKKAMNVRRWLWDELDELAREFSWQLLPNLTPATALRSPSEEFTAIMRELHHHNLDIPPTARGAYRNLNLGGIPLRLYALTWALVSGEISEWTLLLIVGTPSGIPIPSDLKLRVSDQTGILVEQGLDWNDNSAYLFTSVVGNWDEKFLATVSLGSMIEETLPPFSFNP
ncbi:MAG TPA: hypothetical protein DEG17_00820 [Cyanobacteria bacterium UBA11149]|nr:hypothetical protein [Cyanobacteria bacterium UBA11367]HBE57801.1 hypothetical protein [Cyanobacteria bacterium UBA11366]HBK65615.1 hypothetical protein [Cyanobacteria bacterium UBA11166]HBR73434.1 hypothetical protein [Cyanobacteria bacterium UBA11159]HBS68376.1 hypothetical protein [Cyanobacteria bacterium UBA11153]HBW87455.1 hypothetical protein [Cyanobacteria bacterium UBA11149]HCA93858.1 hypothetical protein [Cyanobacteria bacterium UBA9226]